MNDSVFMASVVSAICDYAVQNGMEPDDTLRTTANNILALLEISTFNNWEGKHGDEAGTADQSR